MTAQAVQPASARAWLLAIRPATLVVGIAPVLVGAAVAHASRARGGLGPVSVGAIVAALAGALLIQIGTNLANDVFDFEKGADTVDRLGPLRVTQAGLLSPASVRGGVFVCFALASVAGVYLTAVAGYMIPAIGIASILSGLAYTGGPWPLGYHGLGDLFVFVFFGLVAVSGTAFVAGGSLPALAIVAAIPVGALATAALVVNNLRDCATDAVAGKRTLVVRFGRSFGVTEYALLLGAAYVVPVALAITYARSAVVLVPLVTLPIAVRLVRGVARSAGAGLNPYLGKTARLLLLHSALFAGALLLANG